MRTYGNRILNIRMIQDNHTMLQPFGNMLPDIVYRFSICNIDMNDRSCYLQPLFIVLCMCSERLQCLINKNRSFSSSLFGNNEGRFYPVIDFLSGSWFWLVDDFVGIDVFCKRNCTFPRLKHLWWNDGFGWSLIVKVIIYILRTRHVKEFTQFPLIQAELRHIIIM